MSGAALGVMLPVVLIAGMFALVRRPARFSLDVVGNELVLRLLGWDRIWCCRREVRVPVIGVRGVAVDAKDRVPVSGPRWPGAALPGVIRAGSFGVAPRRSFWDVRAGPSVLRIELDIGQEYERLVLQPPDPHEMALRLRPILGSWVPPGA